ncbi:MAG TPA: putative sugar nucleotidyl transferase [Phycisphaerales bacterium]|nr:putative sugar nucleotidyl transferase [Phycisphaerales bacterium]
MTSAHVFDDGLPLLAPLTDLRPSFDVRTGALTNLERLSRVLSLRISSLQVPARLAPLIAKRHSIPVNTPITGTSPVLLINGRAVVPAPRMLELQCGESLVESRSGDLIAACLDPAAAQHFITDRVAPPLRQTSIDTPTLLARPWHVRTFRDAALAMDLELLAEDQPHALTSTEQPAQGRRYDPAPGTLHLGGNVVIAPTAKVYPGVVLDSEHGPIHIADHATIRPGAILIGPCYVGPHCTVLERATIRQGTAIGPWCKVNGEVGGTVFQGYANKAHDGYLGDAYVGEWVNLGAGTTVSNLLNTYGEVITRATPRSSNERTGETFLGPVIGDHVKTAICTRIMTGSILHTGSMFATTAPVSGCVPAFTWATDEGKRTYRLDKFLEVAQAAMGRRKVELSEHYRAVLAALHAGASTPA